MAWQDKVIEGMGLDIPGDLKESARCVVRIRYDRDPADVYPHYKHLLRVYFAIKGKGSRSTFKFYEVSFGACVVRDPRNITYPPIKLMVEKLTREMFFCHIEDQAPRKGITGASLDSMGQGWDEIKLNGELGQQQLDLHATLCTFHFFTAFVLNQGLLTSIGSVDAKDLDVLKEAVSRVYGLSEELFSDWIAAATKRREKREGKKPRSRKKMTA